MMDTEVIGLPLPPPLATLENPALLLDFDGTLVELAATPHAVMVPGELRYLLPALGNRLQGALAIVSGRPVEEIRRLLPAGGVTVVGLHGADTSFPDGRRNRLSLDRTVSAIVREQLAQIPDRVPGVLFEDKGLCYALHYRGVPEARDVCFAAAESVSARSAGVFRVRPGDMVIELCPAGSDKGTAVRALLVNAPYAGRQPVFVGDDLTDEDGFVAANDGGGLGVLVGPNRATRASARLPNVEAMRQWLAEFVR